MRGRLHVNPCALMAAVLAFLCSSSYGVEDKLPLESYVSRSTGEIEMSPVRHSPLYVEFIGSPTLTARFTEALVSQGFAVTATRDGAAATLSISGEIALLGGPNFVKGVKASMGEAAEKSINLARSKGEVGRADFVQGALATAINAAGATASVTAFWRSYYLGNMVTVLAEAGGAKSAFNKALTGDPRGVCLSRCSDWNKVSQTAYLRIAFVAGEASREVRVMTKVFAELVAPDQVVDRALVDAVAAIRIAAAPEPAVPGK